MAFRELYEHLQGSPDLELIGIYRTYIPSFPEGPKYQYREHLPKKLLL